MSYFEKIVNLETGEETERPYTAKEIKEVEKAQALAAEFEAKRLADAETRAALLARIGITEEEAQLLLRGN